MFWCCGWFCLGIPHFLFGNGKGIVEGLTVGRRRVGNTASRTKMSVVKQKHLGRDELWGQVV